MQAPDASRVEVLETNAIWRVKNFLSPQERSEYIAVSESREYHKGEVGGMVLTDLRNNDRVIIDDESLAHSWFERAQSFLPSKFQGDSLVGLKERFRFYRYQRGQTFKPHRDGSFVRPKPFEFSLITFMVYLNEAVTGGATHFYDGLD